MNARNAFLIALALAVALPSAGLAEMTPQQKLMARRAAELDAYRKITETIKGFRISSKTTVKDFVTESDQIRSGFTHFVRGIRIVGDPVYNPDDTVEVTAAVTLAQVIRSLKRIRRTAYTGSGWEEKVFNQVRNFVKRKVITATGYGAPPKPQDVEKPDFTGKSDPPPAEPRPEKQRWIYKPSPVAGMAGWEGVTGQGRLMAYRAALTDAYRKLGETVSGIRLSSRTTVKDFVTRSDEIKSGMRTFLRGIKLLGPPQYNPDGTVEVNVGVTLAQLVREVRKLVKRHHSGAGYQDITYVKTRTFVKKKLIEATGYGAVNAKFVLKGQHFIGWDNIPNSMSRVKLMARQAALEDAKRRFAERVKGLAILSGTYVKDFVAEHDEIRTGLENYLRSMKVVGDVVFYGDGAVEAQMGGTWQQIIKSVKSQIRKRWTASGMSVDEVVRRIRIFEKRQFFAETGYGALPSRAPFYVGNPTPPPPEVEKQTAGWAEKVFRATGYGAPREGVTGPQAKLLAKRAAYLDALRKLTEQVYGLKIRSQTTVKDFVTENDTIESATASFIRGATTVEETEKPDGTWEVTIELKLSALYKILRPYL